MSFRFMLAIDMPLDTNEIPPPSPLNTNRKKIINGDGNLGRETPKEKNTADVVHGSFGRPFDVIYDDFSQNKLSQDCNESGT